MNVALIVAGGAGSRMGTDRPKQVLPLGNMPVFCHALLNFDRHPEIDGVCLVVRPSCRQEMEAAVAGLSLKKPFFLAEGGENRRASVQNGLTLLQEKFPSDTVVLIHDAARPLVDRDVISRCIGTVKTHRCCATALPVTDSLAVSEDGNFLTGYADRSLHYTLQTPQGFFLEEILEAHRTVPTEAPVTDDVSLFRILGKDAVLVPGSKQTLKLTQPEDLPLLSYYLSKRSDFMADSHQIHKKECSPMLRDFSKEVFDIVLQAGQSNSEGCGRGPSEKPFAQNPNIFYFNNDFTITPAYERVWENDPVGDYSLSFCLRYMEAGLLAPGRKLMVVRAAVGGTGFLDGHWKMTDVLYRRMMDMVQSALSLNPENRLVGFLWHQGETDADWRATYDQHFAHLNQLVSSVRNVFNVPQLPFIAGDFVKHWKDANAEICAPVIQAIRDVCSSIGMGSFVETADLLSNDQKIGNGDTIHFCRDALNTLGNRYFEAYRAMLG